MRVILAEKPDMGRTIADVLGIRKHHRGYIECKNGDIVTWAIGHLVRLKAPDQYERYKEWRIDTLPVIPDPMLYEVDPDKKEQFFVIKGLLEKAECCVIATDPGREGEHIGRTILQACGFKGKLKRLWIDDLTPSTIKAGFQNLKDGSETVNLGKAAKVRAYADYWMGFTATRFFTLIAYEITKEKAILSAGRVQTPTLRIVYDRELAIENFVPKTFYGLEAVFETDEGQYRGQWFKVLEDNKKKTRFDTKMEAENVLKKIQGKSGVITHFEEKKVRRQSPQLLHSTSIKSAAREAYGFSIDETMKVLQSIYDKGYVTYPRTSSRHLSENAADQLVINLQSIADGKYSSLFPEEIQSLKGNSRYVNNQKAKEHHAIVPTGKDPSGLTGKEAQLYQLILRYTLAAHYPEGIDKETVVITNVEGETFITKSVIQVEEGWRSILNIRSEDQEQEKERELPYLEHGMKITAALFDVTTGKTTPPKRLADSDLEKAMENAGQIVEGVEDEEVLHHLKEYGLGTPATRTHIIRELVHRGYIEIRKNLVYLTDKGRNFIQLIRDHPLTSIELTGEFEKKLNEVAEGKRSADATLNDFKAFAYDILKLKDELQQNIRNQLSGKPLFENELDNLGSCPKCGKSVVAKEKFYGCTGFKDGCRFTLPKLFLKVHLTAKSVKDLLSGKEILLQNIPGKYGTFHLFVSLNGDQLQTRKPTIQDLSLGSCPLCHSDVLERENFYGCTGFKEGCKFTLPKVFLGKELTAVQVKKLLKNGKTDKIKGFQGKKGSFDSALGYDVNAQRISFMN